MQFRNLTPFDALAFTGVDTQDREYHVVALSVSYTLRPAHAGAAAADPRRDIFKPVLDEAEPLPLTLADEHWGDPTRSSLRRESDLVPYKPRCDVLVVGQSYAATASRQWALALRLRQGDRRLIDKTLCVTGPRHFERGPALLAWLQRGLAATAVYRPTTPAPATAVPLRYELAYGGHCQVPNPRQDRPGQPPFLVNEVCYRNPVGSGWMVKGYLDALAATAAGLPPTLPAPQISAGRPLAAMTQTRQRGAKTAAQMARVRYPEMPVGLGPLGKAWAPRLTKAGTYDDAWLRQRHPYLPRDFDFAYWNGAPEDQQIDFPDLTQGLVFTTDGLRPGGGAMGWRMPVHRALVLMRLDDGLMLPNPMHIDLIELDNNDADAPPRLRLVYRTAVLKRVGVRVLEARFEADPAAPLFQLQPSVAYHRPTAADLALEKDRG